MPCLPMQSQSAHKYDQDITFWGILKSQLPSFLCKSHWSVRNEVNRCSPNPHHLCGEPGRLLCCNWLQRDSQVFKVCLKTKKPFHLTEFFFNAPKFSGSFNFAFQKKRGNSISLSVYLSHSFGVWGLILNLYILFNKIRLNLDTH